MLSLNGEFLKNRDGNLNQYSMEENMIKRLYVPVVLALVAALAFSGVAFAKSSLPIDVVRKVGDVISVDKATSTIKIDSLSGTRYIVHVTSGTVYVGFSGLSALKIDDRLSMELKQMSDGSWTAQRIKLIPELNEKDRQHGVVTAINASSFTIMDRQGKSFTFQVTSSTLFSGHNVPHFRDLKMGDAVTVTFMIGGGKLWAKDVMVTRN